MDTAATTTENNPGTHPVIKRFHGKAIAFAHADRLTAQTGVAHMVVRIEVFPGHSTPFAVVDARWVVS